MIRRPPRSTHCISSAASDVYKRQVQELAKRPGIIKERSQLMDIAYREDTDIEDRTIDSHIKRIRKKFKKVDNNFSAIETRYGSGYRWNVS